MKKNKIKKIETVHFGKLLLEGLIKFLDETQEDLTKAQERIRVTKLNMQTTLEKES